MKLPKVIWFRVSYHVQHVSINGIDGLYSTAMEVHVCLFRKALSGKMVDGDARFFRLRSSRNAKDTTVSKEAESTVFFISVRTDGLSAATMLPAR